MLTWTANSKILANSLKIAILVLSLLIAGCATFPAQEEGDRRTTMDVLSTSIDVLKEKLEGKTLKEVIELVGKPHQQAIIRDHDAWVYVHDGTTSGKAIIFDNDRVIAVEHYE